MRVRQFFAGGIALAMVMTLMGCAMVDRDSLRIRNNGLARDLYSVPGVLDVELDDAIEPGVNFVDVYVRLDYDRGETVVVDDLAAVRQKLDDGDFDLFSITAEMDDSVELPLGATISFDALPTEAELRAEAKAWVALLDTGPLLKLDYSHRSTGSARVFVLASAAVREDGTVLSDDELVAELTAAWIAAGRDADELVVNP